MASNRRDQAPKMSRRGILAAGVGVLLAGCTNRYGASNSPAKPLAPANPYPYRAPARAAEQRGLWYTVNKGDTLSAISRKSGASVTDITRANKLRSHIIKPGQRLWLPDASTIGRDPLAAKAATKAKPKAPSTAPLKGKPYRILPRHKWTRAKVRKNRRNMNGVTRITIHHTGEYAGTKTLPDKEIVNRIDRYHREGRKWAAIGYHWLVGKDGTVYEGRPEKYQGAHTSGANSHNLGISVMGDFHKKSPKGAQIRALEHFLDAKRRQFKVPIKRIYGHRNLSPSICPGDALYAWLRRYKKARS